MDPGDVQPSLDMAGGACHLSDEVFSCRVRQRSP
jgi:hypothetical protein